MAILGNFGQGFMPALRNNSDALLQAGLGLLSGGTAPEQAALAAQGFSTARKRNQTLQYLRKMNPEIAQAVDAGAIDPSEAFKLDYKQRLEARQPHKPNLMGAGGAIYNADTNEWLTPPNAQGGGKLGLNLVWGRDANGNTVAFQPSDAGGLVPAQIPEGVQLSDPYYRAYESASGQAQGKAQGDVIASAPGDIARAEETVKLVDQLISNPGLDSIVGSVDQYRPSWTLDGRGNDALSRLNQLQGGAFLQAFGMLKGGGAITEIEGMKAEQAIARMQRAQDETTFRQSLKDFRDAVEAGAAKLKARASQTGPQPPGRTPTANRASTGVNWSVEP